MILNQMVLLGTEDYSLINTIRSEKVGGSADKFYEIPDNESEVRLHFSPRYKLALRLEFRNILSVTSLVCAISTIIIGFMDYYHNYID